MNIIMIPNDLIPSFKIPFKKKPLQVKIELVRKNGISMPKLRIIA